jgi:hypothetical protein
MPTEPAPITLAQVVHRAVEIVDPADENADVGEFELLFEDADEPVRALLEDPLDERLAEAVRRIDPEGDLPEIAMAAALVRYLAHKPGELDDGRDTLLRLAARAEFHGDPPPVVADWLVDQGVAV